MANTALVPKIGIAGDRTVEKNLKNYKTFMEKMRADVDAAQGVLAGGLAAHALVGLSHTAAGLTAGHFLKALTPTTFGFAAHGLTYTDVGALAVGGTAVDSDKVDGQHAAAFLAAGATAADSDKLDGNHAAAFLLVGGTAVDSDKVDGNHAAAFALSGHTHAGVYEPAYAAGVSSQYYRGDKTWQTLNQAAIVGLTVGDTPHFLGLIVDGMASSGGDTAVITGPNRIVSANGTNYDTTLRLSWTLLSIAAGKSDSGYRAGIYNTNLIFDAGFLGTLSGGHYGIMIQHGIYTGSGAGTLSACYGIAIQSYCKAGTMAQLMQLYLACDAAGGTLTNGWSIYQEAATLKNYFAGLVGIGVGPTVARLEISGTGSTWTSDGWGRSIQVGNATVIKFIKGSTHAWGIGQTNNNIYFIASTADDNSAAPIYAMYLTAAGNLTLLGGFGCNTKGPQTAYTVAAAITDTADSTYSANEVTMLGNLKTLINQLRAALVANGICV